MLRGDNMLEISETFSFRSSRLYAEKLDSKYPFLTCTVIGRTHHSRGIFAYSLGSPQNAVVFVGAAGGKSRRTSLILYRFLDKICRSVTTGTEISGINFSTLIKKFGITVIPCLSPDSVEIAGGFEKPPFPSSCDEWNANAAGVDIDLNFDSDWRKEKMLSLESGVMFAAPSGYPGYLKESEPETRAFTSLCRRRNFRSCLTLSAGESSVFYRLGDRTPASSAMMAKILASSCCFPVKSEEMPPCPSRWFIGAFEKPGFLLRSDVSESSSVMMSQLEEALVLMSVM